MKIVVCIKQVPATGADKRYTDDLRLDRTGVEAIINPLDEYAIEQALRLLDDGSADAVTYLSMGPEQASEALRRALGDSVHEGSEPGTLSARVGGDARVADALAALASAGIGVAELTLGQPSLDDVFFALTGTPSETAAAGGALPATNHEQVPA